jgi:hypothetical protein
MAGTLFRRQNPVEPVFDSSASARRAET